MTVTVKEAASVFLRVKNMYLKLNQEPPLQNRGVTT